MIKIGAKVICHGCYVEFQMRTGGFSGLRFWRMDTLQMLAEPMAGATPALAAEMQLSSRQKRFCPAQYFCG